LSSQQVTKSYETERGITWLYEQEDGREGRKGKEGKVDARQNGMDEIHAVCGAYQSGIYYRSLFRDE
jgi:hypothetical protein